MMKLIANKEITSFGKKKIKPGQVFEERDQLAKVYKVVGLAKDAPKEEPKKERKPKEPTPAAAAVVEFMEPQPEEEHNLAVTNEVRGAFSGTMSNVDDGPKHEEPAASDEPPTEPIRRPRGRPVGSVNTPRGVHR